MWLTSKEYRQKYRITPQHLYALRKSGKLITKPYLNGTSFLILDDREEETKDIALYCRVKSTQKEDLDRQERFLREYAISKGLNPTYVLKDIASGMNENRKGLNELIDLVINKKICKVIISHKDRLTRFGFDYFKSFFIKFGVEIEVVNLDLDSEESFQDELSEDLIAIIHHFSMHFYGSRKNQCKKLEESANSLKELL